MEKDNIEKLINLGLQENEARVYLSLLELGKDNVTEISKRSNLNRTTGYDILERLCLLGIVNRSLMGKKKMYIAEPPSRLRQMIENKKNSLERSLRDLDETLPDLQLLYKKRELKPVIKIAEGVDAMRRMAYNELDADSDIYSIVNLKNYAEIFDEMGAHRSLERFKKGIKEKCLSIHSDTAEAWYKKTYAGKKKREENTEYRWLPSDSKYSTAGEVAIYNDKVLVILSKTTENVAFEIESQSFADFLKIVFKMAWDKAGTEKERKKIKK
jgi:HTH-type transcriptional regulator, sugar sensing transcriptional regulator